jgi:hypothetical protein
LAEESAAVSESGSPVWLDRPGHQTGRKAGQADQAKSAGVPHPAEVSVSPWIPVLEGNQQTISESGAAPYPEAFASQLDVINDRDAFNAFATPSRYRPIDAHVVF